MPATIAGAHLGIDTHANRPAANAAGQPIGALYSCSTHSLIYKTDGSTWSTYATLGGGFATTAHAECSADSGSLTANTITDATGVSVSLAAGTWDLTGIITFRCSSGVAGYCYAQFRDGANADAGGGARGYLAASGEFVTLALTARVTPSGTTTYKVSGQTGQTGDLIKKFVNGTVIGTMITATKVA